MNKKLFLFSLVTLAFSISFTIINLTGSAAECEPIFKNSIMSGSLNKTTNTCTIKLESYTYTITHTDSQGITGEAKDNTGVYITADDLSNLNGSQVNTGDQIKVTFADDETIVKVEKVN